MGIMASNTATDAAQADEKALQGAPEQEPGGTVLDEHQDSDAEPEDDDEYPEGGAQAWLAIAGSFLVYFASFGVVNSFGFFQTFYQQDYLKDYSPSVISFIGTLQITLMYLSGSVAGALFDVYGSKVCQSNAFHRPILQVWLILSASGFICSRHLAALARCSPRLLRNPMPYGSSSWHNLSSLVSLWRTECR